MADDLELTLGSIEGEGPSPDFVANLRERIVAEMDQTAGDLDGDTVIEIDPRSNERERPMTKKRWMLVAAAAAFAVIVGFATLNSGDDGETETITRPEELTTTTTTAATPTTDGVAIVEPGTFDANATLLKQQWSPLEAGTYRVDTVGTPFSFTSDETRLVRENSVGLVMLAHESSIRPDDRDIWFMRFSAFSDPTDPATYPGLSGDEWPVDDFDGWLDNLSDAITVSNRAETTLGGLPATRVDLEVDPASCSGLDQYCVILGTNLQLDEKTLEPGATYRVWMVDQEGEVPLAVVACIVDDSAVAWFDTAEEILATLVFGDVEPSPTSLVPAGPAELPLLGGIRIDVATETIVAQDTPSFGQVMLLSQQADVEFITNPIDLDGNALNASDDFLALLDKNGIEAIEVESTTVDGIDARQFEIAGNSSEPIMKRSSVDELGWTSPPLGKIWLIEHPERGLLMVNAESYEGVESVLQLAIDQAEEILGSLEFIDLG